MGIGDGPVLKTAETAEPRLLRVSSDPGQVRFIESDGTVDSESRPRLLRAAQLEHQSSRSLQSGNDDYFDGDDDDDDDADADESRRALDESAQGPYSRYVGAEGRFELSWSVNATLETVTFDVSCASSAWCSFGLSADGIIFHARGDCVTVWVDSSGTARALEGNSFQQNQPINRPGPAVYSLESGSEAGGRTSARLTRPYVRASVPGAVGVSRTVQKVFWGFRGGSTDPIGGFYRQHTESGAFTANLLDSSVPLGTGEPLDVDPGTEFVVAVVALLGILTLFKLWWRLTKTAHTHHEPVYHPDDALAPKQGTAAAAAADDTGADAGAAPEGTSLSQFRRKSHRTGARLWLLQLSRRRLPRSQVTVLQLGALAAIVLLMFLFVYPLRTDDWLPAKGWGTMCCALAFLAVVPATRNSALTWLLAAPFEQTLFYHRSLGRLTVFAGVMHTLYWLWEWGDDFWSITFASKKYTEGLVSLVALLVIFVTSLQAVRRRVYHHFKTLHFSFLIFFLFGCLHSSFFTPFAVAALVVYSVDLMLREVFGLVPMRLLDVESLPGGVVCLRIPKNGFTSYRPGQYIFINIPSVSLVQWHPFTVSSGVYEDHVTVHIKGLGADGSWTRKLSNLAAKLSKDRLALANTNDDGGDDDDDDRDDDASPALEAVKLPRIRVDGPYGRISFTYKRYETVVLLGGGIGVTPTLSILKELYRINSDEAPTDGSFSPVVKRVHAVFAVRTAQPWAWFFRELASVMSRSGQRVPGSDSLRFPHLHVHGFVSKPLATDDLDKVKSDMVDMAAAAAPSHQERDFLGDFDIVRGRPNCNDVLAQVEAAAHRPGSQRVAVCACGPHPLVKGMWDATMARTSSSVHYDLHREVFNF